MRSFILRSIIMAAVLIGGAFANPIPVPFIWEFSTVPPWLEVDQGVHPGDTIKTLEGSAIILLADPTPNELLVLDSSNTTGFVLDPDGDSIIIISGNNRLAEIGYGTYGGYAISPPAGASAAGGVIINGDYEFAYDLNLEPSPGSLDWPPEAADMWGSSRLLINEVYLTSQTGANFIELYNSGDTAISTANYVLAGNIILHLSPWNVVPPGGFVVIDESGFSDFFDLDPASDVVYLTHAINPYDTLIHGVVDQVGWSSYHGDGVSLVRYPDGNVDWGNRLDFMGYDDASSYTFCNGYPTPGATNQPVGIEDDVRPERYAYIECYPNPFNTRATITFGLESESPVALSIYDIAGRQVTILTAGTYSAGRHVIPWDAVGFSSGIYFARLETRTQNLMTRVVLLK